MNDIEKSTEHIPAGSNISRVHPARDESGAKLAEVAKRVQTAVTVTSYIAHLKRTKSQPKDLMTQYDDGLKQFYLLEWPDAVPHYKSKQRCCCCRDPERDKDARELLRRVLPSYIFYIFIFTGAIAPKSKVCDYLLRTLLCLVAVIFALLYVGATTVALASVTCIYVDANCHVPQNGKNDELELTMMFGTMDFMAASVIMVFLVCTYLRDQLRSPELRTLIASIGPERIGRPRYYW